jgi:hypothetical protein
MYICAIKINSKNKMEIFTESQQNGMVLYVEREAERLNPEGFEVVSREMFSGENRPAVRLRNGSIVFNVYAIRKFGECSHIKMYTKLGYKMRYLFAHIK